MLTEEQREILRQAQKATSHDEAFDLTEPVSRAVIEQDDPEAVREFICRCPLAMLRAEARAWLETYGHGYFGHAEAKAWADAFKEKQR